MSLEVVDTPFGRFQIDPVDIIGSTLKAGTLWDGPGFLQVIAKEYAQFGVKGSTVIDVGANIGTFSVYCAHQGAWRVVAFEPVEDPTYKMLQANLDLNKAFCADAVIPICAAGYGTHQFLELAGEIDPGNIGGISLVPHRGFGAKQIPGLPLDHYHYLYGERVSLIKVDAQGCDLQVLRGLERTINRHRPAIVFEWEESLVGPHGDELSDVGRFMEKIRYTHTPWPTHSWNFLALPFEWAR